MIFRCSHFRSDCFLCCCFSTCAGLRVFTAANCIIILCLCCSTHMQDLQEVTQETHYENYRAEKLANGGMAPAKTSRRWVVSHTVVCSGWVGGGGGGGWTVFACFGCCVVCAAKEIEDPGIYHNCKFKDKNRVLPSDPLWQHGNAFWSPARHPATCFFTNKMNAQACNVSHVI